MCIRDRYELDLALRLIDIPIIFDDQKTANKIDQYYDNVRPMLCIREACLKTIPHRTISSSCNDFVVPGWNEYVRDKHTAASNAFLDWTFCGKSRRGPRHNLMKTTRAQFKLALRYCKQHADMLRADIYVNFFSYQGI